jgi:hypothetical protein
MNEKTTIDIRMVIVGIEVNSNVVLKHGMLGIAKSDK